MHSRFTTTTRPVFMAIALLLSGAASHGQTTPVTVAVGPVNPMPAGAIQIARLMDVPWANLPPGSVVLVGPGNQPGPVTITSQGTAAQPITVRAAVAAQPPIIGSAIDFQGAAYVKLKNMVVDGSPWASVVVRRGSHHLTIDHNTLRNSDQGLSISDGAGTGHQITNNLIEGHRTGGIGIGLVNASPTDRTRIAGNLIRNNGHHGIELNASNYLIEHNTTTGNGMAIGGTSGIHLYAKDAAENSGDDNIIRYNFSYANHDRIAYDGNGIQIDQWCDRNVVENNLVWGNDGAGIIVFDASDNRVTGNTAIGNMRDPKRGLWGAGELIVSTFSPAVDRTRNNLIANNVLVSTRADVPALFVDAATNDNPNTIGPNLMSNRQGGWLLQRGTGMTRVAAELDALAGTSGNLGTAVSFMDEANPLGHGMRLQHTPPGLGVRLPGIRRDMMGTAPVKGLSLFGAYYTAPGL